jgi:hypothetical protein
MSKSGYLGLFGKVLISMTIQASIGNLELPNRFMIRNFATSQEAIDAIYGEIRTYIVIGLLYAVGSSLLIYLAHQHLGAALNMIANLIVIIYVIWRRRSVIEENVRKYGLQSRGLFGF